MARDVATDLGRSLAEDVGQRAYPSEPWRRGTVQALVTGPPPLVTVRPQGMADATADTDMPYFDSYDPAVGDVVFYSRIWGSPFVLGRSSPTRYSTQPWKEIIFPNNGDFTSATFADYITGFTNVPVPYWAQDGNAKAEIVITSQGGIISAAGQFQLRVVAGSTNGTASRIQATAATTQFTAVAGISYTIPAATTSIAVKLQALRINPPGTGALRPQSSLDTIAICDALIHSP